MRVKEQILEKIQKIENESVLQDLLEIIDLELNLNNDIVELTDAQKSAIDAGLQDIDEGRTFSHEQAPKMIDEWMRNR